MSELNFRRFAQLRGEEDELTYRAGMEAGGYYAFYTFVDEFRSFLKNYDDEASPIASVLVDLGKRLFPHPERFSPSWEKIWDEFKSIVSAQNEVMPQVDSRSREGEWQVLIDNPYSSLPVVCYSSLGFREAVYTYAYFQRELKPNEQLRLQKIAQLFVRNGSKEASIPPFE
jgi:hypothetical protein